MRDCGYGAVVYHVIIVVLPPVIRVLSIVPNGNHDPNDVPNGNQIEINNNSNQHAKRRKNTNENDPKLDPNKNSIKCVVLVRRNTNN